jgi:hypothetical protein
MSRRRKNRRMKKARKRNNQISSEYHSDTRGFGDRSILSILESKEHQTQRIFENRKKTYNLQFLSA